ncbi:g9703 [Coccomyxa viridis]|uniref:G9703 protein n=1 Tax=Coccomyxa viridis TaxID=1274662 RepID=A0ABP1G9T8_9CHLO
MSRLSPGAPRESPYSKGVWFVNDQEWAVGDRYRLVKLLGHGSFSTVCLASDAFTEEKVALKRIPDVLSSPEQAKRVLREVCILRRLKHPFLINLRDAFTRPSTCGPKKMINGKLQPCSLDVYIAMEYGSDGDLFSLRGQMSAEEVTVIMWQLLQALKFLHLNNVWHRDIKSSNIMVTRAEGHRIVKVGDFGSARSATSEGYHWAEQGPPTSAADALRIKRPGQGPLHKADSYSRSPNISQHDLYVAYGPDTGSPQYGRGCGVGYTSPLTCMVATPCYRAPEVVMSRGGYTSAIDMWSAGCIFGELLQRVPRIGSATTPHLQVAPLFAIHGLPKTPGEGEKYAGGPTNSVTRKELGALFDVTGTPSWRDVEGVQSATWRNYLQKLPGRAPTLYRRLGFAGEAAVHLLGRMLAFDPGRRISAEEALCHEYFAALEASALDEMEESLLDISLEEGMDRMDLDELHREQIKRARSINPSISDLRLAVDAAAEMQVAKKARGASGSLSESMSAMDLDEGGSPRRSRGLRGSLQQRHFYEEADPDRALAMLEDEMSLDMEEALEPGHTRTDSTMRTARGLAKLRELLEKECEAQARAGAAHVQALKTLRMKAAAEAGKAPAPHEENVLTHWVRSAADMRLKEDIHAKLQNGQDYGQERLAYVADTWKGRLDPSEHLRAGRHGEWTQVSGIGVPLGPRWGVTSIPPGIDASDPRAKEIMRRQQLR